MLVSFIKMSVSGNDFVIIDNLTAPVKLKQLHYKILSDRRNGVGCDQIMQIIPPTMPELDFSYLVYNSDGSLAKQCGNGVSCCSLYLKEHNIIAKKILKAETNQNIIESEILSSKLVRTYLGVPDIKSQQTVRVNGKKFLVYPAELGNYHAVLVNSNLSQEEFYAIAPKIAKSEVFVEEPNLHCLTVKSDKQLELFTYEKGAGVTRACGSGSVVAAAVARKLNKLQDHVAINSVGGSCHILFKEDKCFLEVRVKKNFHGEFRV
jgi:diaminopimelate epimerase